MKNFIETLKLKLIELAEYVHFKLFGHKMSEAMKEFLYNLGISVTGGFIASGLSFAASIFLGRLLGPVEYGNYALLVAFTSFLTMFVSVGLETAIIRYNRKNANREKQKLFSTLFIFFILNSFVWLTVVVVLRKYLATVFSISPLLILLGSAWTTVNILSVIFENGLRSLGFFKLVNIARVLQNVCILFLMILFFHIEDFFSLQIYVVLGIISLLLTSFIFLKKLGRYIAPVFDGKIFTELFKFSLLSSAGIIAGYLIQNGDSLLINHFLGKKELGIYNAYYILSMSVTGQIVVFFISVYFPSLVKQNNKIAIVEKIDKLSRIITVPWIMLNFIMIFLGIKLFGTQYPFDIKMAILFSLYPLFFLYGQMYGYITIAGKNNNMIKRMYSVWLLVVLMHFVVLIGLSFFIKLNVYIILIFYIITYGLNALLNKYYCKKSIAITED
jgi:O-antigen/teichoic acid export membrane protein